MTLDNLVYDEIIGILGVVPDPEAATTPEEKKFATVQVALRALIQSFDARTQEILKSIELSPEGKARALQDAGEKALEQLARTILPNFRTLEEMANSADVSLTQKLPSIPETPRTLADAKELRDHMRAMDDLSLMNYVRDRSAKEDGRALAALREDPTGDLIDPEKVKELESHWLEEREEEEWAAMRKVRQLAESARNNIFSTTGHIVGTSKPFRVPEPLAEFNLVSPDIIEN